MKQSEINQLVDRVAKGVAKHHGWKSSGGFLFTKKDPLFFVILAHGRNSKVWYTVRYKLFQFDQVFWAIFGMEEHLRQPLSFHARGAFVAPDMCILESAIDVDDWTTSNVAEKLNHVLREAENITSQVLSRISSVDENLEYIEELYADLLRRCPETGVNIYRERLMTAMLKKEYDLALRIAEERIAQGDHGGFTGANGRSFFVLAKEQIKKVMVGSAGS